MTGIGANKEQRNRQALVAWGSPWSCGPAPLRGDIQHTGIGRGEASGLGFAMYSAQPKFWPNPTSKVTQRPHATLGNTPLHI